MSAPGFGNDPSGKRQFVATHRRRKDGLFAMLLAAVNGEALYRVQWLDNGKRHENTLARPEATFRALFLPVSS